MKLMKWVANIALPFEFKCSLLEFREVSSKDELSINLTLCFSEMALIFSLTSLTFDVESMSCLVVIPDIPIFELGNFSFTPTISSSMSFIHSSTDCEGMLFVPA